MDVSWCKGVSGRLELLPLQGARSDVKPFVASAMSLTLCGTRLYELTITSPPRPGTTLAVNASHCVHLQDVVLPSWTCPGLEEEAAAPTRTTPWEGVS